MTTPSCAVLNPNPDRSRGDRCPGTIALHSATDGQIGRLRFPGGHITAHQWATIAQLATEFGDGRVHVTTRGNVQFRGITHGAGFAQAVAAAGLLPSPSHDKIRNIIVSPGATHLFPLAGQLDQALLANQEVAGLTGRTLFGFDSGDGLVLGKRPDFGAILGGDHAALILGGQHTDYHIPTKDVIDALVTAAAVWQARRGTAWRVHEHPEAITTLLDALRSTFALAQAHNPAPAVTADAPIGWLANDNNTVTLAAGLTFGFFHAQVAQVLAAAEVTTSLTPWATVMIHDVDEGTAEVLVRVLAPMGLVFDSASPWLRVSACTGTPGCASALSATQQDAAQLIATGEVPDALVHFSGCERRCGHPLVPHVEYLATSEGEYEVTQR